MFVDHKEYMAFDVERHSNVCVCGKEAESPELGYCEDCLEKRNSYIANIVGDISLDDEVGNLVIEPTEMFRIKSMTDRIGYLIDSYISEYNEVPYSSTEFFIRCLHDKVDLLADLRLSLETYVYVGNKEKPLPLTKKKFIIDAYNEYFNKLTNMWNGDWNLIKALGDVSTHKVQVEADKVVYSLTRKTED